MKQKDDDKHDKPARSNDKSSKVPMGIMFLVLCGFSFYLGGIFCSEKNGFMNTEEVVKSVESPKKSVSTPIQVKSVSFPQCSADLQDYTPCTDPKVLPLVEMARWEGGVTNQNNGFIIIAGQNRPDWVGLTCKHFFVIYLHFLKIVNVLKGCITIKKLNL